MYTVQIVCISILAVVLQHGVRLWANMGYWKYIHSHAPGPCKVVQGIKDGSEDIQVLPNGLAFISSGGVGLVKNSKHGIFLFDFNKPDEKPVFLEMEVTGNVEFDSKQFIPHGISIWQNEGACFLYVVNHNPNGDCVEKFKFDEKRLKLVHENTFMDSTMRMLNDIVVIDEDKFYYTNSFYHTDTTSLKIEFFLMMPWGTVGYFNGKIGRVVVPGLFSPNGINVSKDKKHLYVGMYGTSELRIFEIEANKDLNPLQTEQLYTAVDNIDVADDGSVWLGCGPIMHESYDNMFTGGVKASSQILRIELDNYNVSRVTEVYANDGSELSQSSVAVFYKGKMLIGSVRDQTLLCEVKYLG